MSWSVSLIGKPENVVAALKEEVAKHEGQSRLEFEAALPALETLVRENFGTPEPIVRLMASGSGYAKGEEQIQRSLTITALEPLYTRIV